MIPQWHFNERRACDRMRDSANDAFFTAESLENISEALVREGIQNSLDAASRSSSSARQVTVRIMLVCSAPEAARNLLAEAFVPAAEHFEKALTGVRLSPLLNDGASSYLVFEDFGTRGLTGDIAEWRLEQSDANAFFSFFRAEGRSAKTGDNIGRWGIGKQVFPTASQLHAMIGFSVRSDSPAKVLMGSAVVRSHAVDGCEYHPDAWFGCRERSDEQVTPVTDDDFIRRFSTTLGLRRSGESGLSVVIPFVDERVNMDDLRCGVIRNFFWPILLGELIVELADTETTYTIDADTIPKHRSVLPANEAAVLAFADWAAFAKPAEIVKLSDEAASRPDWRRIADELLSEDKVREIRTLLESAQRVGVKVPLRVRPKDDRPEEMSFFTVYIEPCRDGGCRPLFLRDGILIKDVRGPLLQGCRSLVDVQDPPLAGMLGDAEGVNHTQWQKDSHNFHNRYVYGPDVIKFVTRSVFEIMQALHKSDSKGDPTLLLDLFYLPTEETPPKPAPKPKQGEPGKISDPPGSGPVRPRSFDLRKVEGGFILKPGNAPPEEYPVRVRIEAAYAVRRGNPLKRWAADDFVFTRQPLRTEPKAVNVIPIREDGNAIELELRKPEFQYGVCGFDKKRDLVIRVTQMKDPNEEDI